MVLAERPRAAAAHVVAAGRGLAGAGEVLVAGAAVVRPWTHNASSHQAIRLAAGRRNRISVLANQEDDEWQCRLTSSGEST